MGGKQSKAGRVYTSYEALCKELKAQNIAGDSRVVIGIDAKGDPTHERKEYEAVPDKLNEMNTIDTALECAGYVVGTGLTCPYFFGSDEAKNQPIALRPTRGATELLARYHHCVGSQHVNEKPLSLKPIIDQVIKHADQTRQFHVVLLVIAHDLDPSLKEENQAALKLAARYPLSIVIVKTGGSPSKHTLELARAKGRFFDNVTLVDFGEISQIDEKKREGFMGLACLRKVPSQYKVLREKQGYRPPAEVAVFEDANWEAERRYQESLLSDAKLLVLGRKIPTGVVRMGHGAWWDAENKQLHYADLLGKHVFIYNPDTKTNTAINVCGHAAFAVSDRKGAMFVATQSGIEKVDGLDVSKVDPKKKPGDYWITKHCPIEEKVKSRFITCGTVDPTGKLWVCTGDKEFAEPIGGIWCCHGENKVTQPLESGLSHIGGMAFSLDGKKLYTANLNTNTIWVYDHDTQSGVITNARVLLEGTSKVRGSVSDVAVDVEGKIWCPHHGGGAVVRYDPQDKKVLKIIRVQTKLCSSIAFGGTNLSQLFVVTSSETVAMEREYYAGSLFLLENPGVRGAVVQGYAPSE